MRILRTSACISDLHFDAWLGGELNPTQAERLQRHLHECGSCRERKLQLLADRACFAADNSELPDWLVAAQSARSTSWRQKVWRAPGMIAAAAALLLALLLGSPEAGVRSKGAESLSFYVKRGDDVHRGRSGEQVREGDKLRFAYTTARSRYLTIISLDGAGRASVYYPAGPRAAPIKAGAEVPLPSAVELDGELGEERIVALFCDEAVPISPLVAALETKQRNLHPPSGCTKGELSIVKQAASQ